MAVILDQKFLKQILHYDPNTGIFTWLKHRKSNLIGSEAGTKTNRVVDIGINKISYKAHRLAFLYMKGYIPSEVDHIDGNPRNNKFNNLREVTHQQNMMNVGNRSDNTSGCRGVNPYGKNGKYRVRIGYNRKKYDFGVFDSFEEAKLAYEKHSKELFGKYKRGIC